jgi:hypothetical protein
MYEYKDQQGKELSDEGSPQQNPTTTNHWQEIQHGTDEIWKESSKM